MSQSLPPSKPPFGSSSTMLPYGRQWVDEDDVAAVVEVLKGDWITQGPTVTAFENAFANAVGAKHAIAVSSGTAALHLAYLAAGVGPGDEVITSPITFAATANAARLCGAEVKFVDIDPATLCLDPKALERAITKNTKVIAPVDFAGLPCAMSEINAVAARHGLTVIADAAHSLGGTYHNKPVGALAGLTCFSFHPVKSITTGEGGVITTDDDNLIERLKLTRSHGIKPGREGFTLTNSAMDVEAGAANPSTPDAAGWYMEMLTLGLNYRITDLQCALGLSQLKKLDMFVQRRRAIAQRYQEAFATNDLMSLQHIPDGLESGWHLFVIRLRLDRIKSTRRAVYDELRRQGLGVQIHYIPVHLHPYYRERYQHRRGDFPRAEQYYDECISLPIFPAMQPDDVERVIRVVVGTLEGAKSGSVPKT